MIEKIQNQRVGVKKVKKDLRLVYLRIVREKNGVLKSPIEIDNDIFAQLDDEIANNHSESSSNYEINGLFCSMIFNPMGPTIHIMGLMRSKDEGVELFFRTLNPFSCNNYIVASCDDNYNLNLVEIMDEIIGCRFFDDLKLFTTMPTFIVPVNQNMVAIVNNLIESIYFSVEEDLSILNKMFEETLGNPWDLASLQLKRGLSNIKNKPQTTPFKSNVEDLEKYIELVLNPKNISAHI